MLARLLHDAHSAPSVGPMQRWRIAGGGEARVIDLKTRATRQAQVSVDVEFQALMPAIGTDGQGRKQQDHGGG